MHHKKKQNLQNGANILVAKHFECIKTTIQNLDKSPLAKELPQDHRLTSPKFPKCVISNFKINQLQNEFQALSNHFL